MNSGTLQAATANALANTSQFVLNNGGSFLVTAENAVNDNAAINLNGGRMALSGNFNETVGALTLAPTPPSISPASSAPSASAVLLLG